MNSLKKLWHFQNSTLFYGDLSALNDLFDAIDADPASLRRTQQNKLRNLYKKKNAYEKLNTFIKTMLKGKQGTEEDIFARLVKGINTGNVIKNSSAAPPNNYKNTLETIVKELTKLVEQAGGQKSIAAPSIDPIVNAVGNRSYKDFVKEKGQYLEDLGAWIATQAGLTGFSTGSWQAIDKFFNETIESSIIEDVMGLLSNDQFDQSTTSKNSLQVRAIGYTASATKKDKDKLTSQLNTWIKSVQDLNGKTVADGRVTIKTGISSAQDFIDAISLIKQNPPTDPGLHLQIVFSDNLYKQIQKLSVNIQGKSNTRRHLTNENYRNLYYINFYEKYAEQLKKFSETAIVAKPQGLSLKKQKTQYKEFATYVNYNLSKNISKTIYARNDFYLTVEGFADLADLMEKRNFCIRIKDIALSYKQFLENKGFQMGYMSVS